MLASNVQLGYILIRSGGQAVQGGLSCPPPRIFRENGYILVERYMTRSTSYGVYISQLIRFARVSSHVVDFNARNKSLTAKFSNRVIGIINFERLSPNFIADTMNWFLNSVLD